MQNDTKMDKNQIQEDKELKAIGHAVKFFFGRRDFIDTETIQTLEETNRKIDSIEAETKKKKTRRILYPAAAVLTAIICAGALLLSLHSASNIEKYTNNSSKAINFILPDGTDVWLNPKTELTLDKKFGKSERLVKLDGEAYFDVFHDPDHPFIVSTQNFRVKVLGTVFNVRSNHGDSFQEISLAQGSVAMQSNDGTDLFRLRPGQQAVFNTSEEVFEINDIHVGDLLQKQYGTVSLKNAKIGEILKAIYDATGINISASNQDDMSTYNFSFQTKCSAEDIMEMLDFTCRNQHFTLDRQ